jgi:hypothetical protein
MGLTEHFLDAREMEPPEPFDKACAILASMQTGEYLRMLHRRIPYPLLEASKALQLEHKIEATAARSYTIIIYFADDDQKLAMAGIL